MYADRYGPKPIDRASLTLSIAIVGGLVAAAALSNTVIALARHDKPLITYWVRPAPPPPPPTEPPVQPHHQTRAAPRPQQLPPIVDSQIDDARLPLPDPGLPLPGIGDGDGGGTGAGTVIDPPKPPPVLRGADVDGRYARDFQPGYPAEERRAGHEGVVTLKVLIGTDGRVREVERIAAASDAFWRVTQERALAKWRFRPATRNGVAYESWKTMTVRFRLEGEE